ncbi:site-2 protease family protein [Streptomyces regalis]|uniref:Zinc metalloprotease n=1 Tax=Streptomyces regalis TaxID=68262 RepID=A0A0X3UUI8_9ACTN|nr:site-2 protease family protein [Streptomyces regalis]KUL35472.1 peptidase M50 [Streptomyces regalis]
MGETFRLGHIAGIRVGVHWSVLVIFLIIAVGLSEGRLPDAHPGRPAWQYWLVGILTALVFFGSLLAHEVAHAVVARRNGMEADSITLWLLGGAARLKDEAPSPGAELRVAGVGPLVSLVLGIVFAVLAAVLVALGLSGLTVEAVAWLAGINVLLAVFNALPAAPLDGGRLLRAFVWWRTGNRLRATTVATTAGRVLGWVLVVLGVYQVLLGALGGLWLALIGWFLIAAATVEGGQAQTKETLNRVPVRLAMTPDPVSAYAGLTVAELLQGPAFRYRHSAFPVVSDDAAPVGLVTVHRAQEIAARDGADATVADAMFPLDEVVTTGPGDPLGGLLLKLESSPARRALVMEQGRMVGIVSTSDINRVLTWLTSTPWNSGVGHRRGYPT